MPRAKWRGLLRHKLCQGVVLRKVFVMTVRANVLIVACLCWSTVGFCATVLYDERTLFEDTLSAKITDDYRNPGYTKGFPLGPGGLYQLTDTQMSAVLGETVYTATTFPNFDFVAISGVFTPRHCAGL